MEEKRNVTRLTTSRFFYLQSLLQVSLCVFLEVISLEKDKNDTCDRKSSISVTLSQKNNSESKIKRRGIGLQVSGLFYLMCIFVGLISQDEDNGDTSYRKSSISVALFRNISNIVETTNGREKKYNPSRHFSLILLVVSSGVRSMTSSNLFSRTMITTIVAFVNL